uniref:Uncharacterized protein n=1 Tax=Arundo donax TaxID=35708 RepID=A0A0A9GMD2_ARUDO
MYVILENLASEGPIKRILGERVDNLKT